MDFDDMGREIENLKRQTKTLEHTLSATIDMLRLMTDRVRMLEGFHAENREMIKKDWYQSYPWAEVSPAEKDCQEEIDLFLTQIRSDYTATAS